MRLGFKAPLSKVTTVAIIVMVATPCVAIALSRLTSPPKSELVATAATGTLSITTDTGRRAILSASPMIPGQSASGTVTVRNSGTEDARVILSAENAVDHPGAGAGRLSDRLRLVITDMSGAGQSEVVYSGLLTTMNTLGLGDWASASAHTYRFVVTFVDGGDSGSDNAYQGSYASIGFRWTAAPGKGHKA